MRISVTYSNWAFVIISIIFLIITLITAIGNALVFAALFRFKKLRTTPNLLIGNLALSDLLLAITVLPFSAATDATGVWLFGPIMCDIWLTIDVFYCTASVWNLVTIAFDRFTATTFPIWYRSDKNRHRVICYILFVWIFSGFICLPGLLGWGSKAFDKMENNASSTTPTTTTTTSTTTTATIQYSTSIIQHNPSQLQLNQSLIISSTNTHVYNPTINHYECVLFTEAHYIVYSAMGSFIIPFIIMIILYAKIFFILQQQTRLIRQSRRIHQKGSNNEKLNYTEKNLLTAPNGTTTSLNSKTTTNPLATNIKIAIDTPSSNSAIHEKDNNNNSKTNEIIQYSIQSSISSTYSYCCYCGCCGCCYSHCCCSTCTFTNSSCRQYGRDCQCFHSTSTSTTSTSTTTTTTTTTTPTTTTNEMNNIHDKSINSSTDQNLQDLKTANDIPDQTIQQNNTLNPIINNHCSIVTSIEQQSSIIPLTPPTSSSIASSSFPNELNNKMIPITEKMMMNINSPTLHAQLASSSLSSNYCQSYLSIDRQQLDSISTKVDLDRTTTTDDDESDNKVNYQDYKQNYSDDVIDDGLNKFDTLKHSYETLRQDSTVDHINTTVDDDVITKHKHDETNEHLTHTHCSISFISKPMNTITSANINTNNIDYIMMTTNTKIMHKENIFKKQFSLFNCTQKNSSQNNKKVIGIARQSTYQLFPSDQFQASYSSTDDLQQSHHCQQPKQQQQGHGQGQETTTHAEQHHEKNGKITRNTVLNSFEQLKLHDFTKQQQQQQSHYMKQCKSQDNNYAKQYNQQNYPIIERVEQRERRATKRMGLIIIIFALSWIPFTLMYLVRGLCGEQLCPDLPDLRKFVTWLGYVNSTINPILYAVFNVQFRQAFIYFLKCTHIHTDERGKNIENKHH